MTQRYTFTDATALPDTDYYFRLRQTDRDFALTDTRGRVLRTGRLFASGGSLSLVALPAGVYFVRVAGMEAVRVVRL